MDTQSSKKTLVSVIIPAFNEEETVGEVVRSVYGHPLVGEVLVVDDGSTDRTAPRAGDAGARVIRLSENRGKAAALEAGVRQAVYDIFLFLDADISGLTRESIHRLVAPVVSGRHELYVGLRGRKLFFLNRFLHLVPILGGERVLTRALWEKIPHDYKKGFQIEIALNYFSKKTKGDMGFEIVHGLTHRIKEKKFGLLKGFFRRIVMTSEVFLIAARLYLLEEGRQKYAMLSKSFRFRWHDSPVRELLTGEVWLDRHSRKE